MPSALMAAYEKGVKAGDSGLPIKACPYKDKRKEDGRPTWSKAFRNYWLAGWRDGCTIRANRDCDEYFKKKRESNEA